MMHPLEELFTNLFSNEREKLVKTCNQQLSLFEHKIQILLETKEKCSCIEQVRNYFYLNLIFCMLNLISV